MAVKDKNGKCKYKTTIVDTKVVKQCLLVELFMLISIEKPFHSFIYEH